MAYKYLFGPVPSRRLGVSLGIDLVPLKVCSLNCIYCEAGRTTDLTIDRKEYIPVDEVLKELGDYLSKNPELDYITFSGEGEPTLNSGIGKIISYIRTNYPKYKTALITNGTLFYDKKVRDEVLDVDLMLPSIDAASQLVFQKLNRPNHNLQADEIIEGLVKLRKEFAGEIWLEVFIVPNLNDTKEELKLLKTAISNINPDLVQLNTLDRPGTETFVKAVTKEELLSIAEYFKPLPVEVIAKFKSRKTIKSFSEDVKTIILEAIKRRPCTDSDLVKMLNINLMELNKYISAMLDSKEIVFTEEERGIFYRINV